MRSQVGGECEIGIEGRSTNLLLKPSQVGCLISHQRQEFLSRYITPSRESIPVYSAIEERKQVSEDWEQAVYLIPKGRCHTRTVI